MKRYKYIFTLILAVLACAALSGCGKGRASERSKSGELILNTVETPTHQYSSRSLEPEQPPTAIFQIIPSNDGFVLLGQKGKLPALCSYNAEGKILASYDLSWLGENQSVTKIATDRREALHLLCYSEEENGTGIYTLHTLYNDGRRVLIAELNIDSADYISDMVYADNDLYLSMQGQGANEYFIERYSSLGHYISRIDINSSFACISDGQNIYIGTHNADGVQLKKLDPGSGSLTDMERFDNCSVLSADKGKIYLKDKTDVFCYDTASGETVRLFQWAGTGGLPISKLCPLPNDAFLLWDSDNIRIFKQKAGDTAQVKELVLALNGMPLDFPNVILQFNDENQDYHITVKDYSSFQDPVQMLATEINSGKAPDLVDTSSFPGLFMNEKAFEDLIPYFEADEDISLSDLMQAPLNAMMTEKQKLLGIAPSFSVWTITGSRYELPFPQSASIPERLNMLGTPYEAFADTMLRSDFLSLAFCCGGTENYSIEDVAAILEWAQGLPETPDPERQMKKQENISAGIQRFLTAKYNHNLAWEGFRVFFGGKAGDMKCMGLPFFEGTGVVVPSCMISIPISSSNKDGAWEFIKDMLINELGKYRQKLYCPMLTAEYKRLCEEDIALIKSGKLRADGEAITDSSHISEFDEMLNGVQHIFDGSSPAYGIVVSVSERYFSGQISAQEAAQGIISRLGVYFAERG